MSAGVIFDAVGAAARAAGRNLAAEVRAIEEGHRCRYDAGRDVFLVRSDSGPHSYELRAVWSDGLLFVVCDPRCPSRRRRQATPGQTGCKHAALVARRLERTGFASLVDGRWTKA